MHIQIEIHPKFKLPSHRRIMSESIGELHFGEIPRYDEEISIMEWKIRQWWILVGVFPFIVRAKLAASSVRRAFNRLFYLEANKMSRPL